MTNEDIMQMAIRGERSALLLGQISGQIHLIMNSCECAESKEKLENLFTHIMHTISEIFYKPQLMQEQESEDIHGCRGEEPTEVLEEKEPT